MAGGVHHFLATALFLSLITSSAFLHPANSKPNGFSLRIIPSEAPESPLYPGNLTQLERIERMINFTKARADYFDIISSHPNSNANSNSNSTAQPDALTIHLTRQYLFHLVSLTLGTPGIYVYLVMDTGGGLIWTQCQPCINCFEQGIPIYDSTKSTSYRKLPCSHPLCQGPGAVYQCVNEQCVYDVSYGGAAGPVTKGIASIESITIPPWRIDGLIFGCSNDNTNMPFPKEGIISGIMGLNSKPDSLISQLPAGLTKRCFSYCLLAYTQALMLPFLLTFGEDVPIVSGVEKVPFATPPLGSYYYHLDLYDISVAGVQLDFPIDTFQPQPGGTQGFFIDSGCVFPLLDQNAHGQNVYLKVTKAFENYYNALALPKVGRVPEGLELCYVYTPNFNQYASMTYHLQDANYELNGQQVHLFNIDNGYFCVALMKGSGVSVLGAWHQQNMRIIYDLNTNQLQFAPEKCQ